MSQKPQPFVDEPQTLAEHLFKQHYLCRHQKKDVAAIMGVNWWTYNNWEEGHGHPCTRFMPKVIAYLGYDPFGEGDSFEERLMACRRRLGETRKEFGKRFGVTTSTVWAWECESCMPRPEIIQLLYRTMISSLPQKR